MLQRLFPPKLFVGTKGARGVYRVDLPVRCHQEIVEVVEIGVVD